MRPGRLARTLAICVAGTAAFHALSFPLPFLLGPLIACLAAALCGVRLVAAWTPLTDTMRTILGVAVGAAVTPALLGEVPSMALSLLLVPVFLGVCGVAGYPYLRRAGFDRATAFYAAMPGGLQDMLAFGEEAGGDARALSLLHAMRVTLIVVIVPVLLTTIWSVDLTGTPGDPISDYAPDELLILAAAALAGWRIAARLGLFGASILGPMILSAALSLGGLVTQRPPAEAIAAAQFFIGMVVGVKYSGITLAETRRFLVAGLGHAAILTVIAALFAETVVLLGLAPQIDAILAFSPGGQAEMAIMALVAGADVAFVIAHHLARIVLVITLAPLVFRLRR